MPATFAWDESNGAAQTLTQGVTSVNWKNADTATGGTDYQGVNAIVAGNNSFEKWQFGRFSGTYSSIAAGLFGHTAGALGTGLTLKGPPTMTSDTTDLAYATPAVTANASLTSDITAVKAIDGSPTIAVWFGATSPTAASKAASTAANPGYTNYLTTQLQTAGSAVAGDTATVTLTLRYDET